MQSGPENSPWVVTHLVKPWHRDHPRFVVVSQLVVAAWMGFIGLLLCAIDDWAGALLIVAAGLLLWFVYQFRRSVSSDREDPRQAAETA